MTVIPIGKDKSYEVKISDSSHLDAVSVIKQLGKVDTAVIISDSNVFPLYGEEVKKSIQDAGFKVLDYVFPAGEESKNLGTYSNILNFLGENGIKRTDIIIALGGGVTGDLAGFVAASYMRGIRFIGIPTSLLAMVDSSVGGKTGVDLDSGKNLAGAFYRPSAVLCYTEALKTLPEEIFNDGMAEVIKYGAFAGEDILSDCERLKNNKDDIENLIAKCVNIKSRIVSEDEHEAGLRKVLNFGHTLGHAAEKLSNYSLSHGKAVAFGMAAVTRACVNKGICEREFLLRLENVIKAYNLPIYTDFSVEDIFKATMHDKKFQADIITLVLIESEGKYQLKDFDKEELYDFICKAEVNG